MPRASSTQPGAGVAAPAAVARDEVLVRTLREGDEATFARLVDAWGPLMLRMAMVHVPSRAVAEEVVQEAWLTVLRDIDRFERRSSLRTWLLGIVINLARSRGRAERRCTPLSDVVGDAAGSVFEPGRFYSRSDPWAHHWAIGPTAWPTPEQELLAGETREVILGAVAALPTAPREVLVLRDLEDGRHARPATSRAQRHQPAGPAAPRPRTGTQGDRGLLPGDGADVTDITQPEMACRELVELVTDYLEDRLPVVDRTRFEAHIADCEYCATYLEQMRQTIRTLGRIPEETLSDDARQTLLTAFRSWRRPM